MSIDDVNAENAKAAKDKAVAQFLAALPKECGEGIEDSLAGRFYWERKSESPRKVKNRLRAKLRRGVPECIVLAFFCLGRWR